MGIDLGISNFAAVAYSTEDTDLYPGSRLVGTAQILPVQAVEATAPGLDPEAVDAGV